MRKAAAGAALALLMVTTVLVGTAGAETVACGAVITKNTKLTADVGPCPGVGIIVAANGITLDLNGHRVTGKPQRRGNGPDAPGVVLRQVRRATVMNGTVRGFDAGVLIGGGGANTVHDVRAVNNVNYRLVTGRNALPQGETYEGPPCDLGDGIAILGSSDNTLHSNTVRGNGPYSGIALIGPSNRNRVAGNEVSDNDLLNQPPTGEHGTICGGQVGELGVFGRWTQDVGIRIEGPGAQHNVVSGNQVHRNSLAGIMVTAFRNEFPMANNGFNQIVGNTVSQTGLRTHHLNDYGDEYRSSGIYLHNAGTTAVSLSFGNTVAGNNSSNNFGGGIEVLGPFPGSGEVGVGGNTIIGNIADDNLLDGIFLGEGVTDHTVSGNSAHGNAPDQALIAAINARDPYTIWAGTDGADMNYRCDNNVWSANLFGTVNQRCVKANGGTGKVVGPVPPAPAQSASLSLSQDARGGDRLLSRGGVGKG